MNEVNFIIKAIKDIDKDSNQTTELYACKSVDYIKNHEGGYFITLHGFQGVDGDDVRLVVGDKIKEEYNRVFVENMQGNTVSALYL